MKRTRLVGLSSIAVALVGSILLAPPALAASDYYVSPSGSDANPGTSADSPFGTIQRALDVAPSGSTVHLASGVYLQDAVTRTSGITVTGPSGAVVKGGGSTRIFQVHHDNMTLTG
ncbi:MAG: DUF1565 domain-containing protein, partial [Micromonosporaceae bacterium]|nr:DUF1565 domain-containing protein [Micromonosporaceae bacterium]